MARQYISYLLRSKGISFLVYLKSSRLAVYLYHPVMWLDGKPYVKEHHGRFIDEIASYFASVSLLAPSFDYANLPAWAVVSGRPIYQYQFKSPNVHIVDLRKQYNIFGRHSYFLRFPTYLFYLLKSDYAFFFTPSISSIAIGYLAGLLNKRIICYVAQDIDFYYTRAEYGPRFRKLFAGWVVKLQEGIYKRSIGLLVTGGDNYKRYDFGNTELVSPLTLYNVNDFASAVSTPPKNNGTLNLLFVGGFDPSKRLETLIECASILREVNVEFKLRFVGNGLEEYVSRLRRLIDDNQLNGFIEFVGYIVDKTKLSNYYQQADFLLLVSEAEGFPKVVYEAMLHGAIPLLTKLPSYEGILLENENCYFVGKDVAHDLAQLIINIDDDEKERIRQNNYRLALSRINTRPEQQFLSLLLRSIIK